MKTTWKKALVAFVVVGCVVSWGFAQQLGLPPAADVEADVVRPVPPASGSFAAAAGGPAAQPPQGHHEEVHTIVEVSPDGKVLKTYRGGSGARYGGSSAGMYFGQQHDPETAKLFAEEEEAAKEAQTIATQLRSLTDEKGDVEATKKLRDALTRQFEAQQKRRAHEISKIEERLGKLKETMKKRDSAKDTIIGRRLDELTGVTDDLGWEETGGPPRVRVIQPNYGPPGTSPVPAPRYPTPSIEPRPR